MHHSFDIQLAATYGINAAIIIHHFQHWVSVNKRLNRNQHDGKTWTYQTLDEIAAHFPYLSREDVRGAIELLCNGIGRRSKKEEKSFDPVLVKGNYNKKKFDKTVWYAFADESKFLNNSYERETSQIEGGDLPNPYGRSPTPIPDTKPDTKPDKELSLSEVSDCPSAEAADLVDFFLSLQKENNPKFKDPNKTKWAKTFDLMIRRDNRTPEEIKEIATWASKDPFWSGNVLSPDKLRQKFDQLVMRRKNESKGQKKNESQANIRENLSVFNQLKSENPGILNHMRVSGDYLLNTKNSKDMPLSINPNQFMQLFLQVAGVRPQ